MNHTTLASHKCLFLLHQLVIDSPVSPMSSILPLIFMIVVTAVKQGYEDWRRHTEDNKVNNAPVRVIREGAVKVSSKPWGIVQMGLLCLGKFR